MNLLIITFVILCVILVNIFIAMDSYKKAKYYLNLYNKQRKVNSNLEVDIFFNKLIDERLTLKQRSKFILVFIQDKINDENFEIIEIILCKIYFWKKIDLSLLQTIIFSTKNISSLQSDVNTLNIIFNKRKSE